MPELRLHPNIQFIYELVLAERELEAMGKILRCFPLYNLQRHGTLAPRKGEP